jgi:DNA-binding NarL/FixJ family response regulator
MDIKLILETNYLGKIWSLIGEDYKGLDWLDESPKPTEKELKAQWEEVQSIVEAKEQAKIATRQSALAKLAALGLTEEEIGAL